MSTIIYLTRPIQPKKEEKTITFPLFKVVFDKIKKIKNDVYQRKIDFLHRQAFIEFYYQFAPRQTSGVDIPAFMYSIINSRQKCISAQTAVNCFKTNTLAQNADKRN